MLIEVCVEGADGAAAAEAGGADRIELCAALIEGGITPSAGVVRATLAAVRVPVRVMVRPRGGDFLYSDREFAAMLDDVAALRHSGAEGVVAGCLAADGTVDEARTRALVEASAPLKLTFHRAFDMTRDKDATLEALIRCGVDCVLTSGGRPDAIESVDVLHRLGMRSAGRITVMACGGLRPETIGKVRRATGLTTFHFAAPRVVPSAMVWRNPDVGMGGTALAREYELTVTDPDLVRATIAAAETG
jgi:copper homeostasis protein